MSSRLEFPQPGVDPPTLKLTIAANFKPTHPLTSDSFGKYIGDTAG